MMLVEIGVWFAAFLLGLISLSLFGAVFTPGSGSHFGGLGLFGALTGLPTLALIAVGAWLTSRRLRVERKRKATGPSASHDAGADV